MKNELMKLLKKKAGEGKMLSEDEKSAKMDVLDELSEMMGGEAAEGLKKVTVMSPTKEGMEAGLEKAKEVMEKKVDAEDAECEMMDEEGFDQEIGDDKAERIAELKAQIAELEG